MEEALLLIPVERNVGGVQIQYHLRRRGPEALHAQGHQQPVQALGVHHDLAGLGVVAPRRRQFQPVQGALAGQRGAVSPARGRASRHRLKGVVPAQVFVVVQVLLGEGEAVEALQNQRLDIVNHQFGPAMIGEAGGDAPGEIQALVARRSRGTPPLEVMMPPEKSVSMVG